MIDVHHMTLTYPSGKGVFDLDFHVSKGEVMGYLGPNGAGKTTTIRALMGFMRPDTGTCSIGERDCIRQSSEIQRYLGYIPGEMSFPDTMSGDEFLLFMQDMRRNKDRKKQRQLLDLFELDPRGKIRKFSKGMKQKLGIVTALMHDPEVLILDEPTSGLDPLMQSRFIELILQEKARGKTILMSSHSFGEVERTCDNALIIKVGRIIEHSDVKTLKGAQRKTYLIKPADPDLAADCLTRSGFQVARLARDTVEVTISGEQVDQMIKLLAETMIQDIDVKNQTLEDVFMQFYGKRG